jgi:hypothetical protein
MDTKEPDSKVDIVKEVASALEDEDFQKDEPKTVSKVSPMITSATSSEPKQPTKSSPFPITKTSSPSQSTPIPSPRVLASPPQERMRSEAIPPQTSSTAASSGSVSTETTSTTWQTPKTQENEAGGGMWGWMSNAVSAGLQTTQNIGRNIVEKTKVRLNECLQH